MKGTALHGNKICTKYFSPSLEIHYEATKMSCKKGNTHINISWSQNWDIKR